jgi:preprotein translocase subunit YajC
MNYPIAGFIVIVAIAIIFWLIRRNKKDEKSFEQELNKTEIHPGTDDEPKV